MRRSLLSACCLLPLPALAAIQVSLTPSLPSPQPVATPMMLQASATDTNPGLLTYRFTLKGGGASSRVVRDFSQAASFDWAGTMSDGLYQIQVTARNNATGETAQTAVPYRFVSRLDAAVPLASATAHPLVALFSAPPCASGSKMRVRFSAPLGTPDYTDWRACSPVTSMNFYVAGMRAGTRYTMAAQTMNAQGTVTTGASLPFTTGTPGIPLPAFTVASPADASTSRADDLLLSDFITVGAAAPGFPVATDLAGRPVWYYPAFSNPSQAGGLITRPLAGSILVFANGANSTDGITATQVLREIDLAGNALRETNAARVREQLATLGLASDCRVGGSVCAFTGFHHDAIRLANGHTIALGYIERMFPAGTQGSSVPVNVLGDIVVDLDENFQVVWYWNSFDHLNVNQRALLNEVCVPGVGACPPLYLNTTTANDWLHANALQYLPDGHLIVSVRHLDWVIKIAYADGAGSGAVLWRLGQGGDFAIVSTDPWPWFSHQHDGAFEPDGRFTVFDNGNTRVTQNPGQNSRGQAYQIDEVNMVATQLVNADLGVYSFALGSAQLLSNGNYHFLAGFANPGPSQFSQSIEALTTGVTNHRLQAPPAAYRSFRMKSLYAPPGT